MDTVKTRGVTTDLSFSASSHLTNNLDFFLQDETPFVAHVPTPLPSPTSLVGMDGGLTGHHGGQTSTRPEDGSPTTPTSGPITPSVEAGSLTAPLGGPMG
jgi:hypothetical protein